MSFEWVVLLAGAGVVAYLFANLRARERALNLCRAACQREQLQLLDNTLRCVRLRTGRDEAGRLRLRRTYRFEFTATGMNRREGDLVLLGAKLETLRMEPYEAAPLHVVRPTLH